MTDAIIDARQPEPGRPGTFRRTFVLPLQDVPDEVIRDIGHPMHEANIREVVRDGVRRGLRHRGEKPVVDEIEQRDDGQTAVTYALKVAPTDAAVAVSTAKRRNRVRPPVPGPEPEFTADRVPDDTADELDEGQSDGEPTMPASRHSRGSES